MDLWLALDLLPRLLTECFLQRVSPVVVLEISSHWGALWKPCFGVLLGVSGAGCAGRGTAMG